MSYQEKNINGHKVSIFPGYDGTSLYVTDPNGIQLFAHKVSGDPMEKALSVIAENSPKVEAFDAQVLSQAATQAAGQAMLLGEERGSKMLAAIDKAQIELSYNKTIKFDAGILSFVSRHSNRRRIVTSSGCVESHCDCKNAISYHKGLFLILSLYQQLKTASTVREFRPRVRRELEKIAA